MACLAAGNGGNNTELSGGEDKRPTEEKGLLVYASLQRGKGCQGAKCQI